MNANTSNTIIRMKQAAEKTGLSKATIYAKLNPKDRRHDPSFPRLVKLTSHSVGFVAAELEAWINARMAARDGKAA